jgi:hypothetical protein
MHIHVQDNGDPHHANADPDPSFHFNAYPDPTFHFDASPAPAPHYSETVANHRPCRATF